MLEIPQIANYCIKYLLFVGAVYMKTTVVVYWDICAVLQAYLFRVSCQ